MDSADTAVHTALARTFDYAGTIYDSKHAAIANWLRAYYGIYPAFAGTGYSVPDSYYLDEQPMTSQLVKSDWSEYLLTNVSLKDAGCSCINLSPYRGRASGVCKTVSRLRTAHANEPPESSISTLSTGPAPSRIQVFAVSFRTSTISLQVSGSCIAAGNLNCWLACS